MQEEHYFSPADTKAAESGFMPASTYLERQSDESMKAFYANQEFNKEVVQIVADLATRGAKGVPDEETIHMRCEEMGSKNGQIAQGELTNYELWSIWKNGGHLEIKTETKTVQ